MSINICHRCGLHLDPDQICPACLLEFAAETEVSPSEQPPLEFEIEFVRQAFPQLEIIEMIGHGGMGVVFKARQPKLDRFVALKILFSELAEKPAFAERFAREGRLLAQLNHPNIIAVYDYGESNGMYYLIMEYVDGVNLRQAMRSERLTPEQAFALVARICDALQFAHEENVLHRDIKPENILLDIKGRVKIADFGLASVTCKIATESFTPCTPLAPENPLPTNTSHKEVKFTQTGQILGTPNYMSPEQFESADQIDSRTDVYSLGVVFYELLTGQLPKGDFPPPSETVPVGAAIDDVVQKAIEKNREKRYQSAEEFKTKIIESNLEDEIKKRVYSHWRRIAMFWLIVGTVFAVWFVISALNGDPFEEDFQFVDYRLRAVMFWIITGIGLAIIALLILIRRQMVK
jgi:serine/threonine protein kinase